MSDIGALVERLVAQGVPVGEASEIIALAVAAGAASFPHRKSPGAIRQQRYRDRKESVTKRNESVTQRNECEASQSVTNRNESVTRYAAPSIEDIKDRKKEGRATQLRDGWRPGEAAWKRAVEKLGSEQRAEAELVRFRNHAADKGRTSKRWDAAWDNWCDKALKFDGPSPRAGPVEVSPVDYEAAVKLFAKTGVWSRWAGPEPSQLGCVVPPEMFAKYGLLPDGRKVA